MTDSDDSVAAQERRAAAEAGRIGGDPGPAPEHEDPAERPVREGGGGEAEGFEDSERALIDHAAHGDLGHSPRHDAFTPEVESDRSPAEHGDADRERVSEVDED